MILITIIAYLLRKIQKEQKKHCLLDPNIVLCTDRPITNNLQGRELHPRFKPELRYYIFKMSVTPCRSQRSLHNENPIIAIVIVIVIIRLLSKELYSLLEWNLTWGGGKVLLKPLLCMLSSITFTSTDPISFPIPLLSSLNFLRMHHLFSNFPFSYTYRTSDEEKTQTALPPPNVSTIGRGSLRFKLPEACLGAENLESRKVATQICSEPWWPKPGETRPRESTNSVRLCAPTLDQNRVTRRISNTPPASTQGVSEAACARVLHACLQRGRVWDALILPESPKLFRSLSRPSRVPGLAVSGLSSPRA